MLGAVDLRSNNATQLRHAANELDGVGPLYGRASTAAVYDAFADLLRSTALLVEWRNAVVNAELDADRFLRGAKERHRQWFKEYKDAGARASLEAVARSIEVITSIDEVAVVCGQFARTPLPIGVFSDPEVKRRFEREDIEVEAREIPEELAVAFLRFQIDGQPAAETHFLTPNETHDLEIEVRVSRWPDHATHLVLMPLSIEPRVSYDFPTFEFKKPSDDPPFKLHDRGRAVLRIAQGLHARPYEFKYAAVFQPDETEQPVAVVGQRTLRIEGFDLVRNPVTGYVAIDQTIVQIRDRIRAKPRILASDLANLLTALKPICSLTGRSVQDALFRQVSNEAGFQKEIRDELRRDPAIGSELEEHPKAAGGITDLSFRGVRIELKFSDSRPMAIADCDQFIDQVVAYVVGTGKRVGILCVLDNSKKTVPAFPAEEGIVLRSMPTNEGTVEVVVILIQGGLARPSDLSR
ncbi:hypothetical protein CPter291_1013 [Collimonas pratensis]|uniref:Uncharacterized protein n=1 Tax=Collimonas pratensis TaxID=279113 RepID=A0ABM5Z2Y5_9BURK|nr:hypothetical protein CPter291_1013 [Collimonas pratensis]